MGTMEGLRVLGAIVGDIVGSPYEFDENREIAHSKVFPLYRRIRVSRTTL